MAVFVDNPCKVDSDTIIDHIAWSTCDPIAALSTSRLDENEKEKFQVLFVNDEVKLFYFILSFFIIYYLFFIILNLFVYLFIIYFKG